MAFSIDHTKASQGRYMPPEGAYEVVIASIRENQSRNGARYLDVKLVIRSDVLQEGQGESFQHAIWRKKAPGPSDPEGFPQGLIQNISKCVGIDNGMNFTSLTEWMECLPGRPIRVTIRHEEYNGAMQARVAYIHPPEIPYEPGATAISPEDLPF